jgi:hypothetical protein
MPFLNSRQKSGVSSAALGILSDSLRCQGGGFRRGTGVELKYRVAVRAHYSSLWSNSPKTNRYINFSTAYATHINISRGGGAGILFTHSPDRLSLFLLKLTPFTTLMNNSRLLFICGSEFIEPPTRFVKQIQKIENRAITFGPSPRELAYTKRQRGA